MIPLRNLGRAVLVIHLVLLAACDGPGPSSRVELPDEPVPYTSVRFDHAVFRADFSDPATARQQLYQPAGIFYCYYVEDILRLGACDSMATVSELKAFATWPDMVELQQQVDTVYPASRVDGLDEQFRQAIGRWHTLFPDSLLPVVIYMNSGLNFSAFSSDSFMAVGLDYFLGPDNPIASKLPSDFFPTYLREDMLPEYAVVNTIKDFCQREVAQSAPQSGRPDLLHLMVYHGKVMYLLELLLPDETDAVRMNWTDEQQQWALANEWNTWKELARQEVMFNTSSRDNIRWFDFGPFTNAAQVPQESPPQLGIWMGWNMVRAYMADHPETPVAKLLADIPDRAILSAYKPEN
ncbi:MAG: hypothetical protein ACK5XV_02190 [Flavobacteriales bacterium]|jgi:hypothetical protein